LDHGRWEDSDITLEDLEEGYRRVVAAKVNFEKVRVTGGEPLYHPQFLECMELIQRTWNSLYPARTCVFTNNTLPLPPTKDWRYRVSQDKATALQPSGISPADLGLHGRCGTTKGCHRQTGCGRLFDAYGFSFCIFAGAIGRAIGVDPYYPTPVFRGEEEICKHCPFSLGVKGAFKLFLAVKAGELKCPTKTYAEGLKKWKNGSAPQFAKFKER